MLLPFRNFLSRHRPYFVVLIENRGIFENIHEYKVACEFWLLYFAELKKHLLNIVILRRLSIIKMQQLIFIVSLDIKPLSTHILMTFKFKDKILSKKFIIIYFVHINIYLIILTKLNGKGLQRIY